MNIDQSALKSLLRHDADTGSLFWRERPTKFFTASGSRSAEHKKNNWNAKMAGAQALATINAHGYRVGGIFGKTYAAHRVIWVLVYGEWPSNIDHINGVKTDNRIENLRDVPQKQNARNCAISKNNKSGVMGVYWQKNRQTWNACIKVSSKTIHLGAFLDKADAVAARKLAEIEHDFHSNHGRAAI